ncbi:hypothetical protein KY321_04500, partial [Candidatus Woesearchaeota archaeon]|nr:hypothetical protein [Candidatus Woesearchaeota archaeon]
MKQRDIIENFLDEVVDINENYGINKERYDHFTYLCAFLHSDEMEYENFINNFNEDVIEITNQANDA